MKNQASVRALFCAVKLARKSRLVLVLALFCAVRVACAGDSAQIKVALYLDEGCGGGGVIHLARLFRSSRTTLSSSAMSFRPSIFV